MAVVQVLHAATFAAHHSASLGSSRWFAGPLQGWGRRSTQHRMAWAAHWAVFGDGLDLEDADAISNT